MVHPKYSSLLQRVRGRFPKQRYSELKWRYRYKFFLAERALELRRGISRAYATVLSLSLSLSLYLSISISISLSLSISIYLSNYLSLSLSFHISYSAFYHRTRLVAACSRT